MKSFPPTAQNFSYTLLRSSSVRANAEPASGATGAPPRVHFPLSTMASYWGLTSSSMNFLSMLACRAGTVNWGVRWNTVRCPACSAITGIDCTPLDPVPITATRFPEKSTGW